MHYSGYDVNPVNCGSSRLDGHSLAYDSAPESRNQPIIIVRGIDLDMARWSSVMVQDGTKTEIGTSTARTNFTELKNVWMYPNQVWDTTPLSRDAPIWVKIPKTDRHTM